MEEMNGGGKGGEKMEEDGKEEKEKGREREKAVLMWGYLPGVSLHRSPLLYPVALRIPESAAGDVWTDVCGGGCGFAMAISGSGRLLTWGSTDDMGQSYLTSGKHEKFPEALPLPTEAAIVNAAAGWAHCVAVTAYGEVYTWGWTECVPTGRIVGDQSLGGTSEKDEMHSASLNDQGSPKSQMSRTGRGTVSGPESSGGEESTKRRKLSSAKLGYESPTSGDETLSAPPCLVTLNSGVRIATVAAGGRHTLALSASDVGQVWGWGYGGEGQLGLGSRICTVFSPHPIPCIEPASYGKDQSPAATEGNKSSEGQAYKVMGSCIKAIACGGRHSVVVTDTGALLTFGWGLYGQSIMLKMRSTVIWETAFVALCCGFYIAFFRKKVNSAFFYPFPSYWLFLVQCGQGSTDDELSPTCVSSLLGIEIQGIAAGLWHTVCTSVNGDVFSFGGNQFGQLGTGSDQAETLPKLLDAACLENKNAKMVSCGARHSSMITEDGEVFCWGWNKYGQLGLGDAKDRNMPSQVPIEDYHPTNVCCGWWHTLVLAESPN